MKHETKPHRLKIAHANGVEHEFQARNLLPTSNLEQGWVIDSCTSTHMAPFKKVCNEIQSSK